jgi:hypothetical protein
MIAMKPLTKHLLREPLLFLLLHCMLSLPVWAQQKAGIPVSGLVKDSAGLAIANATVLEKGTKNAVTTNIDGAFSIKIAGGSAVLIISSVGYVNQEIPVNNQASLSVLLKNMQHDLGEVVVVGYGTQKKASVIGAIAAVSD